VNKSVQIKRITALWCVFGILPLCAMENEKKLNEQKVKILKNEFRPTRELLIYPEDAHIEVENLPQDVKKMIGENAFIVPIGMDAKLIHPTLVPKRIVDRQIKLVV
jgi:hypothetical protein